MRRFFSLLIFGFFFLTALGFTWPLVLHLPTHLPLGTETAATVPLFNLWTLIWNAQSLAYGYAGYWNAPIFYPEPGTFALSDPQPLTGVIFALPYFLFSNAVLAYNLVFLGFLALNGVAGTKWGEVLAGDGAETEETLAELNSASGMGNPLKRIGEGAGFKRWEGGLVIGLFAQSLPFVTREWGVLQLMAVFPVFFALAAGVRFGRRPSLRDGLALGGWIAVTFLTSSYYGLFLMLMLPLGVVFVRREHLQWRAIMNLLAGTALAGGLLWPVLSVQIQLTEKYTRSESTIKNNSAWGVDYLRLDGRMWGNGIMPWLQTEGGSGQKLYPGTGLLILAGVGVVMGWRRNQRLVAFCLFGAGLAMGISFGLNLEIGGIQPYQWIREFVPGFEQLRSPFRMGMLVQVFLVGLAGVGISRFPKVKFGAGIVVLMGLVSLAEVVAPPARMWTNPTLLAPPGWVGWLAEQPAGGAAIIPFAPGGEAEDFEATVLGMVLALSHGKPLVNGYSGFFPQASRDLSGVMVRQFPNENSLARLREAGVVYLIVDREGLTTEQEVWLLDMGVEMGWEGEETVVFVLP